MTEPDHLVLFADTGRRCDSCAELATTFARCRKCRKVRSRCGLHGPAFTIRCCA